MGACCTKDDISGGYKAYEKDEKESNGGDDGENVRNGDFGAIVRLQGSTTFTSMYTQRGRKGINQDAMTVWEDFTGEKDTMFCGVFDGHGPSGHRVARHARDMLPSKLSKAIKWQLSQLNCSENGVSEASAETENNGAVDNLLLSRWEAAIVESFKEMDRDLGVDSTIDSFCSGTTAVTIIKQIWDVLTNKQVISIVASARNRSMAAKLVVKLAVQEWKHRFPGSIIDDCAVICLFFKNPPLLTKSMTTVTRHNVRRHPELTVSRSCRSVGRKQEVAAGSANANVVAKSREEGNAPLGLSRINSLFRLRRLTRVLSNQKMEKKFQEVEAR